MNLYYFGTALNLSTLYMIAGLGSSISIKEGDYNLGGEGQIYLGGFVTAVFLTKFSSLPPFIALTLAMLLSFFFAGLLTLLSAFLKKYRNADFLFTSYIASAATIPFIDGMISGPFRSQGENLLATPFIENKFRLSGILKPSALNVSLFLALALCILFFFLFFRTSYGRKLCIYGKSRRFALYCGYNENLLTFSAQTISGGMHGLCGGIAVVGTYFTCHSGFYSGMGWNALCAALIAQANPLFLIPSSLFMGFIITISNNFALYHNFGFDMAALIQAFILLLISFPLIKKEAHE